MNNSTSRRLTALLLALVVCLSAVPADVYADTARTGWVKQDGSWYYLNEDGSYATGWLRLEEATYYLGEDGVMVTGFTVCDGKLYYFASSGALQTITGWKRIDGTWYYFNQDHSLKTGWLLDGGYQYYLREDGSMVTGVENCGGSICAFASSGRRLEYTGWQQIDGNWYYFASSHTAVTGWRREDSTWYYLRADGVMATGWEKIDGCWYYFLPSGAMTRGMTDCDGELYYFTTAGVWRNYTGWRQIEGKWYYFNEDSSIHTGWKQLGSDWYYLGDDGVMATGMTECGGRLYYFASSGVWQKYTGWKRMDGKWFYFESNGSARTGWFRQDGKWYYFRENGEMATGWLEQDGERYYLKRDGVMASGEVLTIDGFLYKFHTGGKLIPFTASDLPRKPYGHHTFVYNMTDDILIYSSGGMHDTLYPASTTKVLTCVVAMMYLNPDDIVTLGAELTFVEPDASRAYLGYGEKISVRDLVAAVMVPSGSDAAFGLAAAAGRVIGGDPNMGARKAVDTFMNEVNRQAALLGLNDTHYTSPDGFPDFDNDDLPDYDHHTSMADTIQIAKLAVNSPTVYEVAGKPSYVPSSTSYSYKWYTCVPFLAPWNDTYYDPYVTGLKTGTSTPAGCCLIATVEYGGKVFILGSFGCSATDQRFRDVVMLKNKFIYGK